MGAGVSCTVHIAAHVHASPFATPMPQADAMIQHGAFDFSSTALQARCA